MQTLEALIIGLVRGIAEVLPVSGSGHGLLLPYIVGWKQPKPAVVVAMLAGTLVALLYVFGKRFREMLSSDSGRHLASLVLVGALPAAVIGLALSTILERTFGRPVATSAMLGVTGYLLFVGERWASEHEERVREERVVAARAGARGEEVLPPVNPLRSDDQITSIDAIYAGAGQGLGFVSGISRTGATIVSAMRSGLNRETALRYAFLLTVPSLCVAIIAEVPRVTSAQPLPMIAGFAASVFGGIFGIRWFTKMFSKHGLKIFGVYCFAIMIAGLLAALARG